MAAKSQTHKTCAVYVLFYLGQPKHIYQTEWFKYSRSFSMSNRDMFSFMSGVCEGLGVDYSFDSFDPTINYGVSTKEV